MEKICNCPCHIDGAEVLHAMPCCNICYEKYITKTLEIDKIRYKALIKKGKINLLERIMSKHFSSAEANADIDELILDCLIDAFNLGIDRANIVARIIDDPSSYCGSTGSEYPPGQIIDRKRILEEKIKI